MTTQNFQLDESAALSYESQKVPAIFSELARATLDAAPVKIDDYILDIACGTGIIGRTILETTRPVAPISCVDSNRSMISLASKITGEDAGQFTWHVAKAEDLPFASGTFTRAFCQQGFQYFKNPVAAAQEIHRVLKPNGMLATSIWAGHGQFFRIFADAVGRHADQRLKKEMLSPGVLELAENLPDTFLSAGFTNIDFIDLTIQRRIKAVPDAIHMEIMGHPVGKTIQLSGKLELLASQIQVDCETFRQGNEFHIPQTARLFLARTG